MTGWTAAPCLGALCAVLVLACGDDANDPPTDAGADASATGGTAATGGVRGSGGSHEASAGGTPATEGGTTGGGGSSSSVSDAGGLDAARDCGPNDAGAPDAALGGFCSAAVASDCVANLDQEACERIIRSRAERAPSCCHDAVSRLLECGGRNGLRCASLTEDVLFTPECAAEEEELDVCTGSGDHCTEVIRLSLSDAGAACRFECDQYAADCFRGGAGEISCTCTFGPHLGHPFTVQTCDVTGIAAGCK